MAAADIPVLVKHVTVAVYNGGRLRGRGKSRFEEAYMIARATLTKQGYLVKGSEEGPSSNIKLTAKGKMRNLMHRGEGASKNRFFDQMFSMLEKIEADVQSKKTNEPDLDKDTKAPPAVVGKPPNKLLR
jgi:hypothetical protein